MTLLVLDLHTPLADAGCQVYHTIPMDEFKKGLGKEVALLGALGNLVPHFLPYILSFLTLGIFWVGQQNHNSIISRPAIATSPGSICAFLFAVSLIPFSTGLLAHFYHVSHCRGRVLA